MNAHDDTHLADDIDVTPVMALQYLNLPPYQDVLVPRGILHHFMALASMEGG